MNRSLTILTWLVVAMAIGEFLSAVVIAVENYAGSVPAFAVLFGVLFSGAAWLLYRGHIVAGAALATFLCLFELVSFPSWQKHNSYDWVSDSLYALLAAVTLGFAITVLVTRRRSHALSA
jgi:hypothetical protein